MGLNADKIGLWDREGNLSTLGAVGKSGKWGHGSGEKDMKKG